MLRRLVLGLLALAYATDAQAQVYRPGFGFGRPGFQFLGASATLATYDFAGNVYPAVSVSRASPGYVEDLAGNPTLVAANTLRRTNRGALIEPAATNQNRNSTLQGAAVGSPGTMPNNWALGSTGGLTRQIVAVGTLPNGMEYVDFRLSGTTTSTVARYYVDQAGAAAYAAVGQTWTTSIYASIVGGSTSNILNFRVGTQEYAGATAGGITVANLPLTADLARKSASRALSGATTDNVRGAFDLNFNTGVAVDITIRIALPQTELGSAPSSGIRTTGSAVTRAADVATITAPSGSSTARFTLDDGTMQDASIAPGTYTIPTTFAPKYIARMELRP